MKRVLLIAFAMLAAVPVLAQQGPINVDQIMAASRGAQDWSMQLWTAIFGEFARSPFDFMGGPNTLLGSLFIVFNGAVFAVSMSYLGYGLLAGVVGTSMDGQALGQRINTAWYPIRVITGISGALPVLGGFTLSQGLLMWLAALGIGTANMMWTTAVQSPAMNRLVNHEAFASKDVVARTDAIEMVRGAIQSNICMQAMLAAQQEIVNTGGGSISPFDQLGTTTELIANGSGFRIKYGTKSRPTLCGMVSIEMDRVRDADSMTAYRNAAVNYQGIKNSVAQQLADRLQTVNSLAEKAATDYLQAAKTWRESENAATLEAKAEQVRAIVDAFMQDVRSATASAVSNQTPQVTAAAQARMLQHGWLSAGSYFSTFAEANAALADALSGAKVTVKNPGDGDYLPDTVRKELEAWSKSMDVQQDKVSNCMFDFLETETGNCSLGQKFVQLVMRGTTIGSGGGGSEVGLVNPIIAAKNVGDYTMTLASSMILTQKFLSDKIGSGSNKSGEASSILPGGSFFGLIGKAISYVGGSVFEMLAGFAWIMLFLGALMSIYVPFLPMIAWISGVVAYVASFIEGFVAMPLHGMAHLHTDGEGMGQGTTQGYLWYLNTFARPPLMVLSFFIGSALVIALGSLATNMFIPAMANVQGNSVTGIATIVGLIVIYFVVLTVIINGCFDLIQVIPDQVIGFVGAGSVSTQLGRDIESKVNTLFLAGVRGGSHAMQASPGKINKSLTRAPKEK